jgi:hypothetical protein
MDPPNIAECATRKMSRNCVDVKGKFEKRRVGADELAGVPAGVASWNFDKLKYDLASEQLDERGWIAGLRPPTRS